MTLPCVHGPYLQRCPFSFDDEVNYVDDDDDFNYVNCDDDVNDDDEVNDDDDVDDVQADQVQ